MDGLEFVEKLLFVGDVKAVKKNICKKNSTCTEYSLLVRLVQFLFL